MTTSFNKEEHDKQRKATTVYSFIVEWKDKHFL